MEKIEFMPVDEACGELCQRKRELERSIKIATQMLGNAPEGSLHIVKNAYGVQYYLRTEPEDKSGKYMRNSERKKAFALAQKDYNEKFLRAATKELKRIERFLSNYNPRGIEKVYSNMQPERKLMITPFAMDDEDYVEKWQTAPYIGKEFLEGTKEFYTENGERVRSKSEVIIANMLKKNHIPYRYECPLCPDGKTTIYPDFTILNVRTRKELYLEHLGMLDDTSYRKDAMKRINFYEKYGIFVGEKLILSFETSSEPLNQKNIQNKIDHYFK